MSDAEFGRPRVVRLVRTRELVELIEGVDRLGTGATDGPRDERRAFVEPYLVGLGVVLRSPDGVRMRL